MDLSDIDHAVALNPNLATGWLFSSWIRMYLGEHDMTVEHAARAIRLSPLDPHFLRLPSLVLVISLPVALTRLLGGRRRGSANRPTGLAQRAWLQQATALAGRLDQTHRAAARLC